MLRAGPARLGAALEFFCVNGKGELFRFDVLHTVPVPPGVRADDYFGEPVSFAELFEKYLLVLFDDPAVHL